MVADMMDLRSFETKYLIDCGCKKLVNPFFVEMYKRNSFIMKEKINPFTISFYIAPFINAITRTGTDEEKNIIFSSMIEYEARKLVPSTKRGCKGQEELLVNQAIRTAVNVKKRQDDLNAPVLEQLSRQIEDGEFDYGILIIQLENPVNKGLTGLLANQIMAKYSKPTLILNQKIDEETGEITWEGSGRGYLTDTVSNWREFIQPYATFSEGHPFAFGVCLRKSLWKAGATLFFVYEIFCQVPEIVGEWLCLYAWILHFEYHLLDVFGYECRNFDF